MTNSGSLGQGSAFIAGAGLVRAGAANVLRELFERTNIGVFNTWTAKGLFPWNHLAHLGTIGLQANDIALAGLGLFDDVILCGVSDDELSRRHLSQAGVRWREIDPGDLASMHLLSRDAPTPRPRLYDELAAVCQPMYADESLPTHPARAAFDLAGCLPDRGVVCADAGRSGFWLGRTFPTRELGSVVLPSVATSAFAVTHALTARRTGKFSVAVVDELDDATSAIVARASDLVVEVWSPAGEQVSSTERTARLLNAHESGGVHVLSLGVRFSEIDRLIAVAGTPRWHP